MMIRPYKPNNSTLSALLTTIISNKSILSKVKSMYPPPAARRMIFSNLWRVRWRGASASSEVPLRR